MNNKYEYDEDEDFWYNKEKDKEEDFIDDIIEDTPEVEIFNDDVIPQVPVSEPLDFTQSLPDFFTLPETKPMESEIQQPVVEPIESIPEVERSFVETPQNFTNMESSFGQSNLNEPNFNSSFASIEQQASPVQENLNEPNFANSSLFATISENQETSQTSGIPVPPEPIVEKTIDEKRVPKELLDKMPDLGPEDNDEETSFKDEFKVTFMIILILICTVFISPWIYSFFN